MKNSQKVYRLSDIMANGSSDTQKCMTKWNHKPCGAFIWIGNTVVNDVFCTIVVRKHRK